MRAALYGRIVFGASAVLFGVIALMWHDADTWQSVSNFWKLPFGTAIGEVLVVALVAGGIGILIPQTVRLGSIVLCALYALFSLACVPGIVRHPNMFVAYDAFFEQFCMLSGAVAVYAVTDTNGARAAALCRAARIGLGLSAIAFALAQAFYLKFTASLVPAWIPPNQMFWALLTTVAFALAGIAMLLNVKARLAMRLMTLMLAIFGVLIWVPAVVTHPGVHGNWSEFAINFLITGAAWVVAECA